MSSNSDGFPPQRGQRSMDSRQRRPSDRYDLDDGKGYEPMPHEFGFEKEHPAIDLPFTANIGGVLYKGISISVTHIYLHALQGEELPEGSVHLVCLTIPLHGFSVTIDPDVRVVDARGSSGIALQFINPTGPHLPQLRYILNSVISGDVINLDSMLHYTGPTQPQRPGGATKNSFRQHLRNFVMIGISLSVLLLAVYMLYQRSTVGIETRPAFVVRKGQEMRATAAGQLAFLNADANKGDILFSIYANTGDVLNFVMPCDCTVAIAEGIKEGSTLLPVERVATLYEKDDDTNIVVQMLMSVEGLNRALTGDKMTLIMEDGREFDAGVVVGETASAATMRGDLFIPVNFILKDATLTEADIGLSARLKITASIKWLKFIPLLT